jgi:anaerobic selenocysteine-containing dehydrogenase
MPQVRIAAMEFDRRDFIKFAVGGFSGTLLSPLPWKLMDDVAIWTQNWSWVPVPAKGKISTVNTVCTLCPGACGIQVRKVGSRVVKIEGRSDYPVNQGSICPLGMASPQILYNEGIRWKGPMKRVGPRGSLEWKEITWNEALDTLASRIRRLREKRIPEKLAAVDGNHGRSTAALLIQRFMSTFGSPHYMVLPREDDTYETAALLMQGKSEAPAFDLENSDFILSFGCPLLDGWGAPGRMLHAWAEWASRGQGKKSLLVQVDPWLSTTASKADRWVALFPGTEAALALGFAHVIIKENLYNKRFVDGHSFGFDDWVDASGHKRKGFASYVLERYTPQTVEKITGVPENVVMEVARKFASARAPLALVGRGKGLLPGSLYEFMAVQALNALVGGINQRGGVLVTHDLPFAPWSDAHYDLVAREGLSKSRIDRAGGLRYPFTKSLIYEFSEAINSSATSPIDTLVIHSANPVYTLPDCRYFTKALGKIPFVVSLSPFKDETSLMADLVLPDHTYLEKIDDLVGPRGIQFPLYALSQPVVSPLYNTKHSGDVIISVAKMLGGTMAASFQWSGFEEALKERVRGLYESGIGKISYEGTEPVWKGLDRWHGPKAEYPSFSAMWNELKEQGCWYIPYHSFGQWEEIFQTPSQKFEFFSTKIEAAFKAYSHGKSTADTLADLGISASSDEVCMPHYEELPSARDKKKYPLILFPVSLINLASGWIGNPPFLNKALFDHQLKNDELFVQINPKTASQYGLRQGSRALVKSFEGELSVRINLFEGAFPGVVFIPLGLGHTAYDRYLKGKGVNPKEIIDLIMDPVTGEPIWWGTRVALVRV